jgi:hypothetical protein
MTCEPSRILCLGLRQKIAVAMPAFKRTQMGTNADLSFTVVLDCSSPTATPKNVRERSL